MEKTLRMNLLFDFYGPLLTERQQDVFQRYFHEDFSLGEIAEQLAVSRQAVYDILKRTAGIFENFESKLGLLSKHQERQALYGEILGALAQISRGDNKAASLLAQVEEKIVQAQAIG